MLLASALGEVEAAVVVAVGVLGVVVTYLETRRKYATDIALALREERVAAYARLWRATGTLPAYPRPERLAPQTVRSLTETLRDWYFGADGDVLPGGMFLSEESRARYGDLQDGLTACANTGNALTDEEYERLRMLGSRLRTALVADLESRRRFSSSDA